MISLLKNSNSINKSNNQEDAVTQNVPPRFVKIDGVMRLNPAFKKYKEELNKEKAAGYHSDKLLPVISNLDDYAQWNAASKQAGGSEVLLSESTQASLKSIQEPIFYQKIGLSPNAIIADLGRVFAKHEAPIGLLNKLMILTEYEELQFIIDDSGSMNEFSDTKDSSGRFQTRWEEACARIKEMFEILAYVPTPKITVCFFNRKNTFTIQRKGETPEMFLRNVNYELDAAFEQYPQGSTPAKECLENSFLRNKGKRVARYFFCDGEPDGGEQAKQAIAYMVKNRWDPKGNPLTLLSCSDKDNEVEWMKSLEEEAPYCAEYDDFDDEAREVCRDQGAALPYTKGFHLIGQLVGAMNPEDLDAMDESIPFTKWTFDNLLGVESSIEEYRYYFNSFKEAQQTRSFENNQDAKKAKYNWESYFFDFATQSSAKNIEGVKNFQKMLS